MAIQVVSGQKQKECGCRKCGSTLSYVYTDIQQQTYRDISGCMDTDYYIICPVCNNRINVSRP